MVAGKAFVVVDADDDGGRGGGSAGSGICLLAIGGLLNCLLAGRGGGTVLPAVGHKQTNKQINRQTDKQTEMYMHHLHVIAHIHNSYCTAIIMLSKSHVRYLE